MMPLGCCEINRVNMGYGHWMANPGRICTDGGCERQSIHFPLLFYGDVCVEREEQKHLGAGAKMGSRSYHNPTLDQARLSLCCMDCNSEDGTALWACKHPLPPQQMQQQQAVAPSLNCSHPCTPVLKLCKPSQLPSDLPPARTDSSLCWEDCEEVSLSSFSHLRRTQKSDVPFLRHPHHQASPKKILPPVVLPSLLVNLIKVEMTIHSSHLMILFGGVIFFLCPSLWWKRAISREFQLGFFSVSGAQSLLS